jgi:hypothetical protein
MKTKKICLLLTGIVFSFLTTQAQVASKMAHTAGRKPSAQKAATPVDKSREFAKVQRKKRANERRMIRREAKLNKKINELVLRMTGGYAYLSAP